MKHTKLLMYVGCIVWLGTMMSWEKQQTGILHPGYSNQIIAISQEQLDQQTRLTMTFKEQDPICTYAPASYAESKERSVQRYFLPRTTLVEGLSHAQVEQKNKGVQVLIISAAVKRDVQGKKLTFVF